MYIIIIAVYAINIFNQVTMTQEQEFICDSVLSTILSTRKVENFENSTAILRQTCSKVAEICLLLKVARSFSITNLIEVSERKATFRPRSPKVRWTH